MCDYFILNLSFYFISRLAWNKLSRNLKATNQERLLLKQWWKLSNLGLQVQKIRAELNNKKQGEGGTNAVEDC
jgi:hypothetical protein